MRGTCSNTTLSTTLSAITLCGREPASSAYSTISLETFCRLLVRKTMVSDRMRRIGCRENDRMGDNLPNAQQANGHKPHQHDGTERPSDLFRAEALGCKQNDQDRYRTGHDVRFPGVGNNIDSLQCAEHGDRRRNDAFTVNQSRPRVPMQASTFALPRRSLAPTSDISAKIPPSPWLSARMTNRHYLMENRNNQRQKRRDRMPIPVSGVNDPLRVPMTV
jgi:hypothetical protein